MKEKIIYKVFIESLGARPKLKKSFDTEKEASKYTKDNKLDNCYDMYLIVKGKIWKS